MLALALDDFTLLVVDTETRRVVRKFTGHHGNVNDMVGDWTSVDADRLLMREMIKLDVRFSSNRLSALMAGGWLPWRWIALFAHGICPLEGKSEAILQR